MTDIQPDYTPFLNLVRPDTHDDIRTTVNKLRDALDAVDTWAAAQGGGGSAGNTVTIIGDGTDKYLSYNDRYALVDASAGYGNVHLPSPDPGRVVTVVKTDTGLTYSVFVAANDPGTQPIDGQVDNWVPIENPFQSITFVSDGTGWWSVGMGIALVNPMLNRFIPVWNPDTHRFEAQQVELENLTGVSMSPPFVDGEVVTWDGTFNHWVKRALPPSGATHLVDLLDVQIAQFNDKDLLQFNTADGKWEDVAPGDLGLAASVAVGHSGSPTTFGDIDLSGNLNPSYPGVFLVDATIRANVTLPPAANAFSTDGNQRSAVITFKKIDASANPIHIMPNGSETIDGAAVLDIGTRWESRTLVSDGSNWFTI